jgi:hypothetical protein
VQTVFCFSFGELILILLPCLVVIGYRGREDSRRTGDHHREMDPGSAYLGYRTDLGLQCYNRRQISQ